MFLNLRVSHLGHDYAQSKDSVEHREAGVSIMSGVSTPTPLVGAKKLSNTRNFGFLGGGQEFAILRQHVAEVHMLVLDYHMRHNDNSTLHMLITKIRGAL